MLSSCCAVLCVDGWVAIVTGKSCEKEKENVKLVQTDLQAH